MNRHFKWDKKYLYWGITAFCVVACAILFYMALNYMPGVLSAIGSLFSILSPFIWGLAITYILLPLVKSLQRGVFGALGFLLAIVLMAGVRERLESAKIPKPMRGFSVSLIIAGLMSIAFMGFNGLV